MKEDRKDLKTIRFYIVIDILIMFIFGALFGTLYAIFGAGLWYMWIIYVICCIVIILGLMMLFGLVVSLNELKQLEDEHAQE